MGFTVVYQDLLGYTEVTQVIWGLRYTLRALLFNFVILANSPFFTKNCTC